MIFNYFKKVFYTEYLNNHDMSQFSRYLGLVTFHTLTVLSGIFAIMTLFSGKMFLTDISNSYINPISVENLGMIFYFVPIIQILLTYILFMLGYGFYLEIKPHLVRKIRHREKVKSIFEKEFNASDVSRKGIRDLLFGFSEPSPRRAKAGKMLKEISEKNPKALYPDIDFFIHFLDNENHTLKYYSAGILANLAMVDTKKKLDRHISRYLKLLKDSNKRQEIESNLRKIAKTKPWLKNRIEKEIKSS